MKTTPLALYLFWRGEIFLYYYMLEVEKKRKTLKDTAAHLLLHFTLKKYEDICNCLNMPNTTTLLLNAFPYLSTLKTSHCEWSTKEFRGKGGEVGRRKKNVGPFVSMLGSS